ncbi:chromosome partitioning protein [Candidatus Viridilinea mediisalina]|uniref:Chromosome partitioning protein n=1 Tax=Candidatus Viridilinea mediisalina TaxID=2024553 RepID=A0A2A6RKX3_9CHLR|nr:chromosome partitioning protein [Candidatus Viridilinea mediisalina]
MAHTIALANQKGGVGKTTTAVSVAGELANRGLRVLLVDCDPQGNATTSLGLAKDTLDNTTYDLLMETAHASETIQMSGRTRLDLVPADQDLAGAAVDLTNAERRERRLLDALAPLRASYDYVLLDCPPSLGILTINALRAADSVIIPLQCEYLALEGLAQLKTTLDRVRERLNPTLRIAGVVMTMYDGRTNLAQQVVHEVQRHFPRLIFKTLIPRSVRLSEAPSHGQMINEYDPQSRGARAYAALTDELLQREERSL